MVEHDLEPGDALDQAAAQLEQEEGLVTSTDDDYIDFGDLDAVQPAPTRAQGKAAATEDTAAAADEDEAVVAAEEGVFRHVGRVPAGLRLPAERLRHASDVMRSRTTAYTEIAHAKCIRLSRELADLVAIADERV